MSHVYVFGRNDLTENPNLLREIGLKICRCLVPYLDGKRHHCLIGIPTAGDSLACAASLMSTVHADEMGYCRSMVLYRKMREVKKQHGAHQTWVDGKPTPDKHIYWKVDNVATDGASKLEADQKMIEDGYPPRTPCFILIDRQQGAVKRLEEAGFPTVVAYNLLDITYAYGEWGLWPKDTVKAVKDEIDAHQFK